MKKKLQRVAFVCETRNGPNRLTVVVIGFVEEIRNVPYYAELIANEINGWGPGTYCAKIELLDYPTVEAK